MGAKIGVLLNCGQQSQFSKVRREFDAGRVNLDPPMTCADWPVPGNLTLLHTDTAYTGKPWHRLSLVIIFWDRFNYLIRDTICERVVADKRSRGPLSHFVSIGTWVITYENVLRKNENISKMKSLLLHRLWYNNNMSTLDRQWRRNVRQSVTEATTHDKAAWPGPELCLDMPIEKVTYWERLSDLN